MWEKENWGGRIGEPGEVTHCWGEGDGVRKETVVRDITENIKRKKIATAKRVSLF